GDYNSVALRQSSEYLDGIDGGQAEVHLVAFRAQPLGVDDEKLGTAVLLTENRPRQDQGVRHIADFDDALYAQVRPGAGQDVRAEHGIHQHHAILDRRIDAYHPAPYLLSARRDAHLLAEQHIPHLTLL